jgi:hypothetical protein
MMALTVPIQGVGEVITQPEVPEDLHVLKTGRILLPNVYG